MRRRRIVEYRFLGARPAARDCCSNFAAIVAASGRRPLFRRSATPPARQDGANTLGWFTSRNSGNIKSQIQDNTLALHHLVTHVVVDAVAAVITPIAVLIYLFTVDWGIALCMFIPVPHLCGDGG